MDRQIRVLGLVILLAFGVLFLQLNNVQVVQSSKLSNAPGNVRHLLSEFARSRGVIQTADGVVVARSMPSNDVYKYQREYPEGPLFAHIVGYTSLIYGSDGVERTYNSDLTGHTIPLRHITDILSNPNETENVTLTVSNHLQQVAQAALAKYPIGAVVAMNPANGAVLAMYSSPTYDPNPLAAHTTKVVTAAWNANQANPQNPMLPRAYRRSYAPGSTQKVVTSATVLDKDPLIATQSQPFVSTIKLPNSPLTLSNFGGETCGGMLPELLAKSCDTGFGQIGLDLGGDNLSSEAQAFGYNRRPPIDLPAAAVSFFPPSSAFTQDQPALAYSAIGQQDVSATALQMALVTAAMANNGVIPAPHVMADIHDSQGNLVRAWKPQAWLTATSGQTAQAVAAMMVGVVQNGTATSMALPGIQVAAKTGTAQTAGGASNTNNWMIAFAPAQSPKVVVAAVVPAQPGLGSDPQGATIAGPVAKAVLSAALGLG